MAYLVEVPVEGGGRLLVQAADQDLPDELELAAFRPGEIVARATESLDAALDQLKPGLEAVRHRLKAVQSDELSVEFGIVLGAETGVVVAKGSSEVHFIVTLKWKRREDKPPARAEAESGG